MNIYDIRKNNKCIFCSGELVNRDPYYDCNNTLFIEGCSTPEFYIHASSSALFARFIANDRLYSINCSHVYPDRLNINIAFGRDNFKMIYANNANSTSLDINLSYFGLNLTKGNIQSKIDKLLLIT